MLHVLVCPKCGGSLQPYDTSSEFSLYSYFAVELVCWAVFLPVLAVLWFLGITALLIGVVAAVAVVATVTWVWHRKLRARDAEQSIRVSCVKCLRVFGRHELKQITSHATASAP